MTERRVTAVVTTINEPQAAGIAMRPRIALSADSRHLGVPADAITHTGSAAGMGGRDGATDAAATAVVNPALGGAAV
mgnify:CR=1 FL=1